MSLETDEFGRPIIQGTPVFGRWDGLKLLLMLRTDTPAILRNRLENAGVLVRDDENNIGPADGVQYTTWRQVLTPAVTDGDGNILVPAVIDPRLHINLWLSREAIQENGWRTALRNVMLTGSTVAGNVNEECRRLTGFELIDPSSIATPHNVML